MRWILVFMLLYLIPLTVLFKNYKSFKRACVYGSIYVMLSTTIVITNIYLSGLKIIEETYEFVDLYKVGTLNYNEKAKEIDWTKFGNDAISLLKKYNKNYYIKDDLKKYI